LSLVIKPKIMLQCPIAAIRHLLHFAMEVGERVRRVMQLLSVVVVEATDDGFSSHQSRE
jgi:hypothetical protein